MCLCASDWENNYIQRKSIHRTHQKWVAGESISTGGGQLLLIRIWRECFRGAFCLGYLLWTQKTHLRLLVKSWDVMTLVGYTSKFLVRYYKSKINSFLLLSEDWSGWTLLIHWINTVRAYQIAWAVPILWLQT